MWRGNVGDGANMKGVSTSLDDTPSFYEVVNKKLIYKSRTD